VLHESDGGGSSSSGFGGFGGFHCSLLRSGPCLSLLLQLFHHGLQLRLHGSHPLIGKGVSIGSSCSLLSLQELVDEVCNRSMQYDTHAQTCRASSWERNSSCRRFDSYSAWSCNSRSERVCHKLTFILPPRARTHHPQTGHTVAGLSQPYPS
jgi:hypothetical protein